MVKYRLIYFNVMGRAEVPRLLFALAGVEYEDVRVTPEKWTEMKPNTPFGQLPLLEIDGVQYCQGAAIGNFLAREFGLAGKDNLEMLRGDMIGFCMEDMFTKLQLPFAEKDEKKKAEMMKKVLEGDFPPMLQKLEAMLKQNNGGEGYFLSKLSVVDLGWMQGAIFLEARAPRVLDAVPKLAALKKRVEANPKIAAWIKKRPKTDI